MQFDDSPVLDNQRIARWHDRLDAVVLHVKPWTCAAGGIPQRAREMPSISRLVSFMDDAVRRLNQIVVGNRAIRPDDNCMVSRVEQDFNELLDAALSNPMPD